MVKQNMHDERRRGVRAPRFLSIRHRLHQRGKVLVESPWYISITENMSVSGILFNSAMPYHENDIVELEVVLSGVLDIFKGFARVVRVNKKKSGVSYSVAVTLIDLKKKGRRFSQIARSGGRLRTTRKHL